MNLQLKPLVYGLASFVPGIHKLRLSATGGTDSARYCYSVWLRHLVMAERNRLDSYPRVVAELGPGDWLGAGLAALISGSDKYVALDVVRRANTEVNLTIFDELVSLFRNRAEIPGEDEFPKAKPYLEDYRFPRHILDDERLQRALEAERLHGIKESIRNPRRAGSSIRYEVPWTDAAVLKRGSVDMIFSQAVLEHVEDVRGAYAAMHAWLKPSGFMSHEIDFKSHGTAAAWNGHWAHSGRLWSLIKGTRPYLINRMPHSVHLELLAETGFSVVCDDTTRSESRFTKDDLAPRFQSISDDDLTTSDAFIQAVKILS